jgi:hypothetical protein
LNAANAIGNLKEGWLVDFFKRLNYRKGRVSAVSTTARKSAVIIWSLAIKGVSYINPEGHLFPEQKPKKKVGHRQKDSKTNY